MTLTLFWRMHNARELEPNDVNSGDVTGNSHNQEELATIPIALNEQVVILRAGMDTRALRLKAQKDTKVSSSFIFRAISVVSPDERNQARCFPSAKLFLAHGHELGSRGWVCDVYQG